MKIINQIPKPKKGIYNHNISKERKPVINKLNIILIL